MPCTLPLHAYRIPGGKARLGRAPPNTDTLYLPCGQCLGCQTSRAKEWALRCHLEQQQHECGAFSTITYEDRWMPPTLEKRALQLFLKRVRAKLPSARPIRFFACGEYGATTGRPHYHALLFGASDQDQQLIQDSWHFGHIKTETMSPQRIAYTAGYTTKKLADKYRFRRYGDQVDPTTGEVYTYQPPFLQMSRRPGIGGHARDHASSWRSYAIHNGIKMPVPRFYHQAWETSATEEQIAQLAEERAASRKPVDFDRLAAQHIINEARHRLAQDKRSGI